MTFDLTNQIALVTGGSRGIGKGIAHALSAAGATVAATATTSDGAQGIEAASDGAIKGFVMDVSDPESISSGLDLIKDSMGAPTVLVNNAGTTRDQLLMRMKDQDWDAILQTNLTSVFRLSKACVRPMMKAKFGRVINIGSVIGDIGNAGQANYAAAKAGMIGFTKSFAREFGSRGITANVIAPGFIATDMTEALSDGQREALLGQVPVGTLGSVEDIAAAACYLASPAAQYVTGHTLHVNGGMYMG